MPIPPEGMCLQSCRVGQCSSQKDMYQNGGHPKLSGFTTTPTAAPTLKQEAHPMLPWPTLLTCFKGTVSGLLGIWKRNTASLRAGGATHAAWIDSAEVIAEWRSAESQSKPGIKTIDPEPYKELGRRPWRPQLFMVGIVPY